MGEASKIREMVLKWCTGKGLDLGCGSEKIHENAIGVDVRPLPCVDVIWDIGQPLSFAQEGMYDYVFSSHALEHLKEDPITVVKHWFRVIRTGGYLVLYLPDMDYYTQPNPEHFQSFRFEPFRKAISEVPGFELVFCTHDVSEPGRYSFLIVGQKNDDEKEARR